MHYVEFDEANDRMHVPRAYVRPGARAILGSYAYGPYDWIGPVFRRGECLVVDDVQTSPVIPDAARPAMSVFPARAFISAPLVKDGRLVAALSATVEEPRTWTPDECGLVQETAERTWAAVERARAEAALKQANDALEQRVLDRTAQLAASNAALEREVREHRLAEQQIKALFRRLISTQEEERRRIARDIHDQVGQQMTALRLRLEALRARAGGDPTMGAQVEGAQRLAEELDQSIEFLTSQLRPSTLDNLGLAVSLRDLVHGWGEALRHRRRVRDLGAGDAAGGRCRDQPLSHRPGGAAQRRQACAGAKRLRAAVAPRPSRDAGDRGRWPRLPA